MDKKNFRKKFHKFLPYLTAVIIAAVGYLLYQNLSSVKWNEVWDALQSMTPAIAAVAAGAVLAVYLILSSYDYMSFRYLGEKKVSYPEVLIRAFVCYTFTLNLGSLIGGLALRYRLYSNWKIPKSEIPFVIIVSIFTNWLGYSFLMALTFVLKPGQIAELIPIPEMVIKLLGGLTLSLIAYYFFACYKEKEITMKDKTWKAPKLPFAFLQLGLSSLQWSLLSFIIYYLLKHQGATAEYSQVLFTFLVSSIAGVFTHVPAGLGVIELFFLRMDLGVADAKMLAALIIYRSFYYLIPLILSLIVYLGLEVQKKKRKSSSQKTVSA